MKTTLSLRSALPRLALAAGCAASAFVAAPAVLACGGPFGPGVEIDPAQTIVVGYADGVERYEFNPSFCGKGSEFGLVLPVPTTLEGQPSLGKESLRDELVDLSKPTIVNDEVRFCPSKGPPPGGGLGSDGGNGGGNPGVDVVDAGTVGFLEFSVVKADSEKSLTDFLDAENYPYDDKSKPAFTHYVKKGWYFVAFKVAAGEKPAEGKRLCGALGPIALSFKTPEPVIPTRILFDDRNYLWRVFTIASENRGPKLESAYDGQLQFAGALSEADLATRPALAAVAKAGDRVTGFDVGFFASKTVDDLSLPPTATPTTDFRAEKHVTSYVPDNALCGASGGGGGDAGKGGGAAAGTGGTGGTSGSTTAGAGGAATANPGATPSGGDDGCSLADGGRASQGLLAGLGVALAAFAARRRRGASKLEAASFERKRGRAFAPPRFLFGTAR